MPTPFHLAIHVHDLDAARGNLGKVGADVNGQEICPIARRRIRHLDPAEDAHGTFRQIVEDQVVKVSAGQQLRHGQGRVGKRRGRSANSHDPACA